MIPSLVLASSAAVAPLELVLRSSDGVPLAATYFGAAHVNARAGLLLLPMLGDARASWADFPARAAAAGVAVLTLDPRGHGASGNPYGIPPASWGPGEWRAVVEDARAGLAELAARGVAPQRVTAAGASIGASAALHLAATEPLLAGAALLSPGDNAARLPASTALAAYGKRPLFIGVGSEDGPFLEIARRLSRAASGPTELHELSGPAHGTGLLDGPEGRRLGGQFLRFVLEAPE